MSELSKIKNNRFYYYEFMEAYHIDDYETLRSKIDALMKQGKIVPIKKSGLTSFRPSIYQEYKKMIHKPDFSYLENEIRALHPTLNISGYLNNTGTYAKNQDAVRTLSDYLWNKKEELEWEMSVKERSYAIWKDEKFLESKAGRQICSQNGFTFESLNCFYAPESFFHIDLPHSKRKTTALIIENKDTWYSIGRVLKKMKEEQLFWGLECNLLIYGEGNKVTRNNAITEFMQDYTNHEFEVYYAGDIDVAGINMLYGCMEANPKIVIQPFISLYKRMIKETEVDALMGTADNRGLAYREEFLACFTRYEQEILRKVLDNNKRIPQEILNYHDYLEQSSVSK